MGIRITVFASTPTQRVYNPHSQPSGVINNTEICQRNRHEIKGGWEYKEKKKKHKLINE